MKNKRSEAFRNKLKETLKLVFGILDEDALTEVLGYYSWVKILAGECLFRQGDPGDSLYILINGRMQVVIEHEGKGRSIVGEIYSGETIGEMSIITGEQRSASIFAVRDSVLVKLSKEAFEEMIGRFPSMVINITKLIIGRLKRHDLRQHTPPKNVSIAVLPLSDSVNLQGFIQGLFEAVKRRNKNVLMLTEDRINQMFGSPGQLSTGSSIRDRYLKLSAWLDEQELLHDFVLYISNGKENAWTWKCLRQADEVFLLADSSTSPETSSGEQYFLADNRKQINASQTLVLVHPATQNGQNIPSHTDSWLKNRTVHHHHHIHEGRKADFDRLARFICGETYGLVLSGGGAMGIAHLGVFRALEQYGISIDKVGGTSIGAVFGGLIASGMNAQEVRTVTRKMFLSNPTPLLDYNVLPIVSILRGRTLDRMLSEVYGEVQIEDLWTQFFCVASDLSKTRQLVFQKGSLWKAVRSSLSLPGIFPPMVHDNSLLIDGAIFNNFPVDLMAEFGANKIIGVVFDQENDQPLNFTKVPGTWKILIDRYVRRKRKYHVPSLMANIIQSTTLQSHNKSKVLRKNVDLLFNPDLNAFSFMAWNKFDKIEEAGYCHALEVLEKWEKS